MLTIEEWIAKRKKEDGLNEFNADSLNTNRRTCVKYVSEYFDNYLSSNQPFILTANPSMTIAASLDELFEQAKTRQQQNAETRYPEMVLQHLVAAKLSAILPAEAFEMHETTITDAPVERGGDFVIKNTVIHCTTMPGETLIKKCEANLRAECRPIVITVFERVQTAIDLFADANLKGRVEVWDIQQFLSSNLYTRNNFDSLARYTKLAEIVDKYNEIIAYEETAPSLRIEFGIKQGAAGRY